MQICKGGYNQHMQQVTTISSALQGSLVESGLYNALCWCSCASIDGDADRIVFFSPSPSGFTLLDGDRIAVLAALLINSLISELKDSTTISVRPSFTGTLTCMNAYLKISIASWMISCMTCWTLFTRAPNMEWYSLETGLHGRSGEINPHLISRRSAGPPQGTIVYWVRKEEKTCLDQWKGGKHDST